MQVQTTMYAKLSSCLPSHIVTQRLSPSHLKARRSALLEAAIRCDYVNGCDTSPVLFLEGIYVVPGMRHQGIARALCTSIEQWGASRGCAEFASDTSIDNVDAQALHRALGFDETERVVFFRKRSFESRISSLRFDS